MTQDMALRGAPRGGFLDRERIVAEPGFNRWLVPPAALAVHLCIGMAYGFSVFWLPLSRAIGVSEARACPDMTLLGALVTTTCDWRVSDLVWMYTLFFVFLGAAAAIFGGWLERAGPRKAGLVSTLCWCGGMAVSAFGIYTHQLWIMWLGSGVIGGIGLGLGYISPVSTLIKWFPDRRGMATGMAIMGFGGGAMIGSPLANILMNHFKTPDSVGVWQTFLTLAVVYALFMLAGSLGYRVPPQNWRPEGWTPPAGTTKMIAAGNVALSDAHKTPQFWLLWSALCLNVSASIGIIGVAAPMIQELFGGALFGEPGVAFTAFDDAQRSAAAAVAGGFVGLISLFNIGGRFAWASLSDRLGRKATYAIFFALGTALYLAAPTLAASQALFLFVAAFCIIASMYGGGFATIPAYLADIFGTQYVGAIHGRLLTAWSTAGVLGPLIVAYLRDAQIAAGVPRTEVYDTIFYVLAALLVAGFAANLLVRPLAAKWFMAETGTGPAAATGTPVSGGSYGIGKGGFTPAAALAWTAIGLPIAWGVWTTLSKALVLFQ
ncbi:MFS transporter [Aureimonas sp. Leaf454]|uniref:OFA family MFS transporter n=1 Tax=Aureimonas sp. Leaf454 TaxID=1736381 RepID=UPI0006FC830E|nr:OFA family MFS transporter [Aureimonas sp. Leaf454]KQT53107.1 MFS transporter [Aureimonas sp. Leaf454]